MRYGADTRQLLVDAAQTARKMGHSYVGSVHLLFAMLHRVDLAGKADDQSLSDRQRTTGRDSVVTGQTSGVHTVADGDGLNGFSGTDNMDLQMHHLFPSAYVGWNGTMKIYLPFWKPSAKMKPI